MASHPKTAGERSDGWPSRPAQIPQVPPDWQCLQYLQFLQARQGEAPTQVAASAKPPNQERITTKITAQRVSIGISENFPRENASQDNWVCVGLVI